MSNKNNKKNIVMEQSKPEDKASCYTPIYMPYEQQITIYLERAIRRANAQNCSTPDEKEAEKYYYEGNVFQNGLGTKRDLHSAVSKYEKAAEYGSIDALCRLGEIFSQNNEIGKNELLAFDYYQKAAQLGCLEAIYKVGRAYFLGLGVSKNVKKGEEVLLQAANSGLVEAQFELGNLYKNELRDYEKAMKWFQSAYGHGDYDAAFHMGLMYEDGLGVKQDWDKAEKMYLNAFIELHHPFAPYKIGQLYERGNDDFPADITKSIEWYQEAGKNGLDKGYFRIGEIYENGIGVDKDYAKAEVYYKKSCDSGNEDACERLKSIKSYLND